MQKILFPILLGTLLFFSTCQNASDQSQGDEENSQNTEEESGGEESYEPSESIDKTEEPSGLEALAEAKSQISAAEVENKYGGGDCIGLFQKYLIAPEQELILDKIDCGDYGFTQYSILMNSGEASYLRKILQELNPDPDPTSSYVMKEWVIDFAQPKSSLYREFKVSERRDTLPDDISYVALSDYVEAEFKEELKQVLANEKAVLEE